MMDVGKSLKFPNHPKPEWSGQFEEEFPAPEPPKWENSILQYLEI